MTYALTREPCNLDRNVCDILYAISELMAIETNEPMKLKKTYCTLHNALAHIGNTDNKIMQMLIATNAMWDWLETNTSLEIQLERRIAIARRT